MGMGCIFSVCFFLSGNCSHHPHRHHHHHSDKWVLGGKLQTGIHNHKHLSQGLRLRSSDRFLLVSKNVQRCPCS
uniref:Putative secreted protein n=1 Tax=Anopheles triannulatus TaxID=58253 RepID=A0A2M4B4F5_9DIPT